MSDADLLFPYMFWAQTEAFRSAYCLSQSGMPIPDLSGLAPSDQELLTWPSVEALPALEQRIGELFGLEAERVIATVGAAGAMLVCSQRWFGPGTTVASELPRYEPLAALPRTHGARLVDLERRMESGWAIEPETLERVVADASGPVHVFITNPHNPSGAVLSAGELSALASAIAPTGGVLVCCEAYMDYAPNDQRVHAAHLAPNAVSIGTLTKAYGLGPLRTGWLLLGEGLADLRKELVDRCYLSWVDPPSASLVAARRALDQLPELLRRVRAIEAESRPHLIRWLRESTLVESTIAPFGILSFPRVRGVDDTLALQEFLAEQWDVDVVAGESFGAPGHLRVCCGVPEATLVEALIRLENGIRNWHERGGRA